MNYQIISFKYQDENKPICKVSLNFYKLRLTLCLAATEKLHVAIHIDLSKINKLIITNIYSLYHKVQHNRLRRNTRKVNVLLKKTN